MTGLIVRRTTLICRDAGAMMRFYRDVLGWRVDYDATMILSGGIIPCGNPGDKVQLYIMEGENKEVGKIGLLEWVAPKLPDPGPPKRRLGIGDIVLVADVPDIGALAQRIAGFPGAHIHSPPSDGTFPDPRGGEPIVYTSMRFFDPEGYFYEAYCRHNRPNPSQFLIRRTTCIVTDVPRSLDFLTGTLGLTKYQDSTIAITDQLPAGEPGDTVRFVVCRAQHDYIGMVGALGFLKHPPSDPGDASFDYGVGRAMFVAHSTDAAGLYEKIKATGARMKRAPYARAVPKSGGAGETKMITMGFHDPGGFLWEVNQRE